MAQAVSHRRRSLWPERVERAGTCAPRPASALKIEISNHRRYLASLALRVVYGILLLKVCAEIFTNDTKPIDVGCRPFHPAGQRAFGLKKRLHRKCRDLPDLRTKAGISIRKKLHPGRYHLHRIVSIAGHHFLSCRRKSKNSITFTRHFSAWSPHTVSNSERALRSVG